MAPWREIEDRMERLFEETFGARRWPTATAMPWLPAVEVFEREGTIVVRADLPGLKREEITVEVTDGSLMIAGERKVEQEIKEKDYYRSERSYGAFRRAIPLPTGVEKGKIAATYKDGVLEVTMPKAKGAEATKVTIQ
jgi:HSP20 family protein